jgi:acyl-coenzyme A thioesterase PaaI-like protein
MTTKAIQDYYPEPYAHCYGCGRLNEHGLQIKSYVQGDEVVAVFRPEPYHLAIPGYVYGGLIASLIDCHSIATAAAAAHQARGRDVALEPPLRFVTAALHIDFLKPTPIGAPLELRARAREVKGRKVVVETSLLVGGELRARGEVVAVEIPEQMQMQVQERSR